MQQVLEFVKVYGFPAVSFLLIFYVGQKMFWKIVCSWIDTMTSIIKTLEDSNQRWQAIVDKIGESIDKHTQDSREAHQYTRAEHREITEQQKLVTDELKTVNESLVRINFNK